MDKKIRVLVVDDTAVMRKLVSEVVNRDPGMEVAGVAANGKIALQKLALVEADIVTLDMEMPEMDGIETVREIRKINSTIPVIMLSALTVKGAEATFDALQAGASDYVAKPASSVGIPDTLAHLGRELLPRIRHFFPRKAEVPTPPKQVPVAAKPRPSRVASSKSNQAIDIVAIASSTGGPNALVNVFSSLKQQLSVPIVIVQHMPPVFTKALADRLDKVSVLKIHEATDRQILQAGHVYLAPGGEHMELAREGGFVQTRLHTGPPENSCRPAADVLFRSVASCYGANVLAVVLTGMGRDGFLGSQEICRKGGTAIAQDEESSVVWGMPSFLAKEGLAESVLPLDQIAAAIERRVNKSPQLI